MKHEIFNVWAHFIWLFYSMEKQYRLIIELHCPGCSKGKCSKHIQKKKMFDKQSGLEFDVICICNNH